MARTAFDLESAVQLLVAFHGAPLRPPTRDAFELVLYENVAYLAPDDRRRQAFELLRSSVGTSPEALLAASTETLEEITSHGILKGVSAGKLQKCARIAMDEPAGLAAIVAGPVDDAKRVLKRFPGIGQPGVEKILLFAAERPFLAPESNGLRVLVRLGLTPEGPTYAKTYDNARAAADPLGDDAEALQTAHLVLRLHGRTICRLKKPHCGECPLNRNCEYARAHGSEKDG